MEGFEVTYYLMHKDIITASMEVSSTGEISKIRTVNERHLPLGCQLNMMKFHEWWKDRAVPKTRKGSKHALRELGLQSTDSMLVNCLALSLNDCYWIKPIGSNLDWGSVSLYRNNFTDIFGELTFDTTKHLSNQIKNTYFRYATSQGELQKKWCIDNNGNRFMVKGNWGSSYQQSLNEVFASKIHELQGRNLGLLYRLTNVSTEGDKNAIGCYCYSFCSDDIESISAWELLQTTAIRGSDSYFGKFKSICLNLLKMPEDYFNKYMSYLLMTDFIVSNTDRHMNNIAVLRNANTLECIGFSPIYDTGNSMFFRNREVPSGNLDKIETCSFLKREIDMLKYVVYKDIVNLTMLPDKNLFSKIYSMDIPERQCRVEPLYHAYEQKISMLSRFQKGV